jgi:hypothetical protein
LPEISRFFGIIIAMYYNDHAPPHFPVRYGSNKAIVSIETLAILEGDLSPRVRGLVVEWAARHRAALMDDWNRARAMEPLAPIEPLD